VATARVATGGPPGPRPAAVPLAAVVRSPARPEGYAVFVVGEADGRPVARAREVRLGEIRGNHVEVDEGLAQGDRVVVVGATLLTDGEQVAVLE
jgi:multidrug efflux system membrane fusion protein